MNVANQSGAGPVVEVPPGTPPAVPASGAKKRAKKARASTTEEGAKKGVKTPRTTQPRPTDEKSRAAWKKERHEALGGK